MPIDDSVYVWYIRIITMKMSAHVLKKKLNESKELKNRLHNMVLCVSGWKAHGGTGSLQRGIGKIKRPQRAVSKKRAAGILIIHQLILISNVGGKCPTSMCLFVYQLWLWIKEGTACTSQSLPQYQIPIPFFIWCDTICTVFLFTIA